MPACSTAFRFWSILLGLGILVGTSGSVRAQQLGSKEALQKAFNREVENRNRALYLGEDKVDKKTDVKVAEAAAQYYLYRVTHRLEKKESDQVQHNFNDVVAAAMAVDLTSKKAKPNREYIDLLGPKLVEAMTQVLDRDAKKDPTTVVHASMMLQTMAKLKQDNIGDYLVTLVSKNETHPIVRLYALNGLREYMPITSYDKDANFFAKPVLAKKRADSKYVEALTAFIERSFKIDDLPGDEAAAVYYIRREAIVMLAQASVPAVIAFQKPMKIDGKDVQVEGLVAPTLLKVLAKGALNPPPSLQEKIEASAGLMSMKFNNMSEYNPDLATYLIGRSLVEYMGEYNKDLLNFVGEKKKVPYIAWRTESRRLDAALAQWSKTNGDKSNAELLNKAAKRVLQTIGGPTYSTIANEDQVQLRNAIPTLLPKTGGAVFKTAKAPIIPLD